MADKFIPYHKKELSTEEQLQKSSDFYLWLDERRTVRDFSDKPVDIKVIENCIKAASTAPSGANKQPWTFCVVSNPEIKRQSKRSCRKRRARKLSW
jgi:iodotyrosine deiodinase